MEIDSKKIFKLNRVFSGHLGSIFRIAWSNNGNYIASPSQDSTIKIWKSNNGGLSQTLKGHTNEVNSVSWAPNDMSIASVSDDKLVKLWSVDDGKNYYDLKGHTDEVNDVAWSPDGDYIVSVSDDKVVRIFCIKSKKEESQLFGHSHAIWTVKWSPDGKWIATGADDQTIRLWNLKTGENRILRGHTSTVRSISWFPDSQHLASAGRDHMVRVWDIDYPDGHKVLEGHSKIVTSVSVSYDGSFMASKSHDDTIRIWSVKSWKTLDVLHEVAGDRWSPGIAFNPQRNTLATLGEKDTEIRLWDLKNNVLEQSMPIQYSLINGNQIFISYCHKDKKWLNKLTTMLRPLAQNYKISIWSDKEIKPGSTWNEEIICAIENSKVAVFLVTPDFLASSFITEVELKKIIEQTKKGKTVFFWIPVKSALYEEFYFNKFQAACDPKRPIESMTISEQNATFASISRKIREFMK